MAKLTKSEEKLLGKLLSKLDSSKGDTKKVKPTPAQTLKEAEDWFSKNTPYVLIKSEPNTYRVKNGTQKQGIVAKFSNGKSYQIGQGLYWAINPQWTKMESYGTINGKALYYNPESFEHFSEGEDYELMENISSDRTEKDWTTTTRKTTNL